MNIDLIKDKATYHKALKRLQSLMMQNPPRNSPESDEIGLLALQLEHYESQHFKWPTVEPDPVDEVEFHMDRLGLTAEDLVPLLGSRKRVDAFWRREQPLSLTIIRKLHQRLGASPEALFAPLVPEPSTSEA